MHSHQHFVACVLRLGTILNCEHFRPARTCDNRRFHGSQNFKPNALLKNFASGAILRHATVKSCTKRGPQTCLSLKSTDVPRSFSFRSSMNSCSGGKPRGGRLSRLASSQFSRRRTLCHSFGRATIAPRTVSRTG